MYVSTTAELRGLLFTKLEDSHSKNPGTAPGLHNEMLRDWLVPGC